MSDHAEAHKWLDARTRYHNLYCGCLASYAHNGYFTGSPDNAALAWMQERTSSRISGRP